MDSYRWSGSQGEYLDRPTVVAVGRVAVGLYGGSAARGAVKNEDGALVWAGADWVFAAVLDAHASAESTVAVLELLSEAKPRLTALIEEGRPSNIRRILDGVVEALSASPGRERLAGVRGETACLVCFQQGRYLGWVSIGDNSLYLLHPELARLGQFTLTTRNFFEWIGQRDSLALEVRCYASGVRELRQGVQTIALATDGLLEFGERTYERPASFAAAIEASTDLGNNLQAMLEVAHAAGARDSATVIAWRVTCDAQGLMPTG